MTANLATIKFFVTPSHKCSYLPREDATTLFADPKVVAERETYSELSELGFRRSGSYLYRPHCKNCDACIAVRIPVNKFTQTKRQRRIWRKNEDLTVCQVPAVFNEEHYDIYARYISQKHSEGDMFPPTTEQYESFLLSDWGTTGFFEFRLKERLIAVAVTDIMTNGLSAVYTFYEPEFNQRSLGVMAVLWQAAEAKRRKLPSLYLGYWIKECTKMRYKEEFSPLEMFIDNLWVPYNG